MFKNLKTLSKRVALLTLALTLSSACAVTSTENACEAPRPFRYAERVVLHSDCPARSPFVCQTVSEPADAAADAADAAGPADACDTVARGFCDSGVLVTKYYPGDGTPGTAVYWSPALRCSIVYELTPLD